MKKLFVGKLPYSATEEDLLSFFSRFNSVSSARIIKDPHSGESRGFGFVELDGTDAATAVEELNGQSLGGRAILVSEAREDGGRSNRTSGGRSSNGDRYGGRSPRGYSGGRF